MNNPCSCGSGQAYQHCCAKRITPVSQTPSANEFNQLVALFNAKRYAELEHQAGSLTRRYPDSDFAWKLLGASLQMQGRNALPAFQKVAELIPNDAEAHFNLGVVQKSLGQPDSAVASYRRALALSPDYAEAHSNLGNILKDLGQLDNAVASYQRAIDLKPDSAEAHNNLGTALKYLGQLNNAAASYQRAISIRPDYADAYYNLGNVLRDIGKLESAADNYRLALQFKPDFADALNNLGTALKGLCQFDNAMACYRRAVQIQPDFAEAHGNMGSVLKDIGQLDEAMANYRHALKLKPDYIDAQSNLLFIQNYISSETPSCYLAEARQYGQMVAAKARGRFTAWQGDNMSGRLRVGIVSGDLRNHPVGYFLEGLLSHIDPEKIEFFAYPTLLKEDALSARIKPRFVSWKPLTNLNDEAAAQLIHADGVHVLLDLSGHTDKNRLPIFAWKPAPVQAMWLGYFATTGMPEMDYILGDPWTLPDEEQHHFVEKGWRLPSAQWCMTCPTENIKVGPLPALQNSSVTFGTLNNLSKMNDRVVACWARILKEVPGSRLYLNMIKLRDETLRKIIIARYATHGIAEHRLILEATNGRATALSSYNRIDIALDPFPYPGGTTSYEALWMGVPVLTLRGNNYLSHLGDSIMHNAGLPDWIAADEQDYIAKAVAFSRDLAALAKLRGGLRQQVLASPLFDAPRFATNFQAALWGMWQTHGQRPTATTQP